MINSLVIKINIIMHVFIFFLLSNNFLSKKLSARVYLRGTFFLITFSTQNTIPNAKQTEKNFSGTNHCYEFQP